MPKATIFVSLAIYSLATASSFFAFRTFSAPSGPLTSPLTEQEEQEGVLVKVDPGAPKTESCPLNGQMLTKAERDAWEEKRPLVVMIENHHESRPQAGLQSADVIYETVAEGGITRFMAVFYCDAVDRDLTIGPVRSARTYFLDWASEYSDHPLYTHVGGANTPGPADALGQLKKYGWAGENNLNQFGLSVKVCWRDDSYLKKANNVNHVATEHTMYCSTKQLWDEADFRGWAAKGEDDKLWTQTFTPWKFEEAKAAATAKAQSISFDFWEDFTQYTVKWDYDPATNVYARSTGGTTHQDVLSGEQLKFQVIIAQFVTEKGPIDDNKHMLYGTTGTGKAKIFQNGQVIEANWSKKTRVSRTVFTDSKGKEIIFAAGKIWIEALPVGAKINIQ